MDKQQNISLAGTSNIMRKDKHRENGKCMIFKCILPGFNADFDHLYVHKFPLDQYASLILFALVRKIQWPGKSGEEINK